MKSATGEERAQKAANELSNFVNNYGHDSKAFVEQIVNRTHRTLQQQVMGLFLECCKSWTVAEAESNFDPRNEATVKTAKKIMDALGGDTNLPFI